MAVYRQGYERYDGPITGDLDESTLNAIQKYAAGQSDNTEKQTEKVQNAPAKQSTNTNGVNQRVGLQE